MNNSITTNGQPQIIQLQMDKGPEQTFCQRRYGQQGHDKVFNITNYQRNANKNYNEVSHLPPVRISVINKNEITSAGEGVEKRQLLYTVECKQVQPLWETVWKFLKKLEIELLYDLAVLLLGIHPNLFLNIFLVSILDLILSTDISFYTCILVTQKSLHSLI